MYLENIVDEDPSSKTSEIVGDNIDEDFSFVTRYGSGKVNVKFGAENHPYIAFWEDFCIFCRHESNYGKVNLNFEYSK